MSFKVRLTRDAEADFDRLFDFVLERELARDGGDLALPEQVIQDAITSAFAGVLRKMFTTSASQSDARLRGLVGLSVASLYE